MIDQQFIEQIELLEYIQYSSALVPGFQKAIGFYQHPVHKQIEAVILQKGNKSIQRIPQEKASLSREINIIRQSKTKYEWVNETLVPFKHYKQHRIQKQVFDELDYYILLLKIDSEVDGLKDLLYIYFKPDASNFGLKKFDSNLNTTQKSIIASLLVKSFELYHHQRLVFNNRNQALRNDLLNLGNQHQSEKLKHKIDKQRTRDKINQYIIDSLNEISNKLDIHLQLSKDAQDYINTYSGKLSNIKTHATNAIEMAYRSQQTPEGGILKLEEYHLKTYFDKEETSTISTGVESIADSRYRRTVQLLNRLEEAAKIVQANGNMLTGAAVGQAMDNPISAPAISDALKKHRNKIQSLCNDFPNEWLTIRKSFKPIINTLSA